MLLISDFQEIIGNETEKCYLRYNQIRKELSECRNADFYIFSLFTGIAKRNLDTEQFLFDELNSPLHRELLYEAIQIYNKKGPIVYDKLTKGL